VKRPVLYLLLGLLSILNVSALEVGEQKVTAETVDGKIIVKYNIPEGMHQLDIKDYFKFDVEPVEGVDVGPIIYPDTAVSGHYGPEYHGHTELSRRFTITGAPASNVFIITACYQLCDDVGSCFMPQKVKIEVPIPVLNKQSSPGKLPETAGTPNKPVAKTISAPLQAQNQSLIYMLLLAFLGGLLLNLMPCVLPVLSIKMMSIVGSAHQDKKEIMKGGLVYTAGVLVSFAVLAAVVVFLKKSGEKVGWGFQFQNPYFVFTLMLIIWGFAFSLFEVFIIRLPGMQLANKASAKHGMAGTFMSGVFAVLLATPCTAPMLGTAVGFALRQPAAVIFMMMLFIGLGLALPFIILGFCPSFMKIVPKPGNWMNIFSGVMGFLLLGTALFLARTLSFILSQAQFINVLWFLLLLSFSLWLYGLVSRPHLSRKTQYIGTLCVLVILFFGGVRLLDFSAAPETAGTESGVPAGLKGGWKKFSPELLARLRSENRWVFIDFSAEWCMTCKTNEALVLNSDDVQEAFKEKKVVLLHGDFTKKDPVILEWLHKFGKAGVPLYLLYTPGKDNPRLFPEVITKSMIIKAVRSSGSSE